MAMHIQCNFGCHSLKMHIHLKCINNLFFRLKGFTERTASVQNVVTQVQKQTEDLSNQEYLYLEFHYEVRSTYKQLNSF